MAEQKYNEVKVAYEDIKQKYGELQNAYKKYFPKVDSTLIEDLLLRSASFDKNEHQYAINVITKTPVYTEVARNFFLEKIDQVPSSYEKGTHYLVNTKATFAFLYDIQLMLIKSMETMRVLQAQSAIYMNIVGQMNRVGYQMSKLAILSLCSIKS